MILSMEGIVELTIFIAILYWLFGTRAQAMVDILSTRVQAVYTKWERGPDRNNQMDAKLTLTAMKRAGIQHQREKRKLNHIENLQHIRDKELYNIKETPWIGIPPKGTRPLMGMACGACTPNSKESLVNQATKQLSVKNVLYTDAQNADSYLTRKFCHLVTNFKIKKFDYPQVAGTVMKDERIHEAVDKSAQEVYSETPDHEQSEELYKQILTAQEARARRILFSMRSTLSDFLLRITSWLLYKLLPRFLTSVCLHPTQLDMLQKAAKTNLPLIFIPLHRSHLDYILISFILLNNNIKCPLVAAGNNLRIPVFGWLLRGLGAFFIKRRMDPVSGKKDILYRAVLHTYMVQCLKAGHNIEFFIEGGRTRTGKPCMPKGGILSVIVDAYLDGTVEDALLIPVSVNYEKLVDGNFIREQLGQPKEMETFSNAAAGIWSVLNSNYGSMRIDFNQPFSLRELIKSFHAMNKSRLSEPDITIGASDPNLNTISTKNGIIKEKHLHTTPSSTSLHGTDIVIEDQRNLIDSIARHIIYDCSRACAVMSTNAVSFLLLNRFRNGVTIDKLVQTLDSLRQELQNANKDVGYTGESIDIIHQAIRLLGPDLVKREIPKNSTDKLEVITPVTKLPNVIELSYYNNGILPHFALEGVLATSICSSLKLNPSDESLSVRTNSDSNDIKIDEETIIKHALEVCNILQFEFIFTKPCQNLEHVLQQTLDEFKYKEILTTEQKILTEQEEWSVRFSKTIDTVDEEEDEVLQKRSGPEYKVNTSKEQLKELEFYQTTLRPFVDVYAITALSLHRLVGRQISENEFLQEVLTDIKSHLQTGYCSYGESCSVDPMKNALKLFEKWGVLEVYSQDRIKLVYLSDEYNNEETVSQVFDRIKQFKWTSSQVLM